MARSKSKPVPNSKRRRVDVVDGDVDVDVDVDVRDGKRLSLSRGQAEAIDILRRLPADAAEAAAAGALRDVVVTTGDGEEDDSYYERLDEALVRLESCEDCDGDGGGGLGKDAGDATAVDESGASPTATSATVAGGANIPPEFDGVGRCLRIPQLDFDVFRTLHDTIKSRAKTWTSWSGDPSDPRRRAFGFLPDTPGYDPTVRSMLDVTMPNSTQESAAVERRRNERAMVVLDRSDDVPHGFSDALGRLLSKLRPRAPPDVRRYLDLSELIAVQPNLHNGRSVLPSHVDHPGRDGFGVVIVTVSIRGGDATVILEDADRTRGGSFRVPVGSAYMLSGNARDRCTHGVLADDDGGGGGVVEGSHRESLNLRFGLHGRRKGVDPPFDVVLKHWSEASGGP